MGINRKNGKENKMTTEEDRSFKVNGHKIHFGHDYMLEPDSRRYTTCIIETERHEFYSGIAMIHPKEYPKEKIGWKISLQRACEAMDWLFGNSIYKHLWHEIRLQLHNEHLAKEEESIKKILEEENG